MSPNLKISKNRSLNGLKLDKVSPQVSDSEVTLSIINVLNSVILK
jgi:hypothetical protein